MIVCLLAGALWGIIETREMGARSKCRSLCAEKYIEIDRTKDDWRDWTCRCILEEP